MKRHIILLLACAALSCSGEPLELLDPIDDGGLSPATDVAVKLTLSHVPGIGEVAVFRCEYSLRSFDGVPEPYRPPVGTEFPVSGRLILKWYDGDACFELLSDSVWADTLLAGESAAVTIRVKGIRAGNGEAEALVDIEAPEPHVLTGGGDGIPISVK